MTIDRRPIFTVGMIWTEFVKKVPRTYPRYRRALNLNGWQQAALTPDLIASLKVQLGPYHYQNTQQQFGPIAAGIFGPGLWP